MIAVQTAAAAGAVAAVRADWISVPLTGLAVVVLLLGTARYRGIPLYSWLPLVSDFAVRAREQPAPIVADQRLAPLREVLPNLEFAGLPAPSTGQAALPGVCFDGTGWVCLLRIAPDPNPLLLPAEPIRLPPQLLDDLLVDGEIELDSLQVLVHTTGTPSPELPADSPLAASFRRLDPAGSVSVRELLVALRLGPDLGGEQIEAHGGGADGAARVLRRMTARAVDLLTAAGLRVQALAADELLPVLASSASTAAIAPPEGMLRTTESWNRWRLDDVTHITARVVGHRRHCVSALDDVFAAVEKLGADGPTPLTAVALIMARDSHGVPGCAIALRIGAGSTAEVEALARRCFAFLTESGLKLRRADGGQAPGFIATLPLARPVLGSGHRMFGPDRFLRLPAEVPASTGPTPMFTFPLSSGGAVLGQDRRGQPLAITLFRPVPTRVVLVTAPLVCQVLALRAAAAGASIEICTDDPDAWQWLAPPDGPAILRTSTGSDPGPVVKVSPAAIASAHRPVLHHEENVTCDRHLRAETGPWHTSVLHLDPDSLDGRTRLAADVLVLQRISAHQLSLLAASFDLPIGLTTRLPALPDDEIVVVAGGKLLWGWLASIN